MTAKQENYLDIAFDKGLQLAFPPVLVRLLQALLEPSPSFKSITGYLQMDPMLAGKVLHSVNCGSYGFNSRITDLERAAIVIGTNELLKLVIALSLQKKLIGKSKRGAQHDFADWNMTLWSAVAAESIASLICPTQAREAYLACMLKDLPLYLELCRNEPPPFLLRPRLVTMPWPGQLAEELPHWGYSHPELIRDIFLYWGLPIELAEAVRLHHDFAGRSNYSRLTQSIIYATRWSEFLYDPEGDPGQIVAFELAMAAQLGLDAERMERFRSSCAGAFASLLSQLGIPHNQCPHPPLYEQPLQVIQRAYFLALGLLNDSAPPPSQSFAASLQRYLRLFWDQDSFELYLCLPGAHQGSLFRSLSGSTLTMETVSREKAAPRSGWFHLPFTEKEESCGFLALPRPLEESEDEVSLSLFVRSLGIQIANNRAHADSGLHSGNVAESPFALAHLDSNGLIRHASGRFDELFAQPGKTAIGMDASTLLEKRFGLSLPLCEQAERPGAETPLLEHGWLAAPLGTSPGPPMYIGTCPDPACQGHSRLFLGPLTHGNSLQALALTYSGLVETLFQIMRAHACLLNASGLVIWTDAVLRHMRGANIFAISKPADARQTGWNPSFLSSLTGIVRLKITLATQSGPRTQDMVIAPLQESQGTAYLMLMSGMLPTAKT